MRDNMTRQPAPVPSRSPSAISLEQRMLLDGAAVATAVDHIADHAGSLLDVERVASLGDSLQVTSGVRHAVFIDKSVEDYGRLLQGIPQSAEVFFIESDGGGLEQIAAALSGGQQYDSIQVFSHGGNGGIRLGDAWLNSGNVDVHAGVLAQIGAALTVDGDLLFFGCDVAESAQGKALIDRIAEYTGADVAASTDTTGGASTGGDWELEYQAGPVQATAVVDQRVLDAFSTRLLTGWTGNGSGGLINSDNVDNDEFGWSTAIADNSGMIAVGGYAQGDVYVYRPTGGGDYFEHKISPPLMGVAGSSVDIDGNFLIIGYGSANKAYIYQWNTGTNAWDLRANLTGTGTFGSDVAIQADGTYFRAAVGAKTYNSGVAGQGGVYLYNSNDSGVTWAARSVLSTNDGRFDSELNFGTSVALDGNKLVVGAPGHGYQTFLSSYGSNAQRHFIGRAYVYDWTSANNVDIQDTGIDSILQADGGYYTGLNADPYFNGDPNGQQNFYFGTSVDISYSGTNYMVAVGSPGEGGIGESYVWLNPAAGGATPGNTANQVSALAAGAQFGYSVGIDASTGTMAVGAWNMGTDDGQVDIYKSSAWTTVAQTYPAADVNTRFGWSVAVARDTVVVGSPWFVSNATKNGIVASYLFNSAPTLVADGGVAVNEGTVSAQLNPLANDTDPNYAGVGGAVGTASGGVDVPKIAGIDSVAIGTATVTQTSLGYGRIVFDASTADLDYLALGQSLLVPVSYTMVDSGGESLIGTLNITVNGTNDTPTVGNAIALQIVNNGVTNYLFTNGTNPLSPQRLKDAGAFIDPDATDTFNYKFTNGLQTYTPPGGPLFTINATTGEVTVTGITAGMVGTTYSVLGVRVTDNNLASVDLAAFQCQVARANTAPTATGGTLAVTAYEDNVKPATYSQTGTTVTVTSAGHTLQVGDLVSLDYLTGLGVDDSYVVASSTPGVSFTVVETVSQTTSGNLFHGEKSFVDMSVHFGDVDLPGEELSYSLVGAPSWVSISPVTGKLTIFGGNNDIPTSPAAFTVRVTDKYLQKADKLVNMTLTPVNDAPALSNEVTFTSAYLSQAYANTDPGCITKLPADLFTDIDLPTPNTFAIRAYVGATEITNAAGSPAWLRFDAASGRFYTSGIVTGTVYQAITVKLVATDTGSPALFSEYSFDINLFAPQQNGGQVAAAAANNAAGYAVAVSENGLWMAVGEPEYDAAGANYMRGQVSIYNWSGAAWTFVQTIAEPTPATDERFGYSLDLSNDGERLIVGAPGVGGSVGAVYTYQRGGLGTFGAVLATYQATAGDRQAGDLFGFSVALNRDGSKFAVGAPGDDTGGTEAGAAYLFNWGTAAELAKRLPVVDTGEAVNGQHYDRFGWSVAFDGNVLVVGAPFDSVNNTVTGEKIQFNGSATVLGVGAANFNGAVIKGAGENDYDSYGWSVSVDAYETNTSLLVAVGAPGSDLKDTDAGAVYLYRWAGILATPSQANLDAVIVPATLTAFDGDAYHRFGASVAIDAQNTAVGYANDVKDNGVRLAVGSKLNGTYGGNAYLFRAKTDWTWFGQAYNQVSSISTQPSGNEFGWSVALSNAATSAWNAAYAVAANAGRIAVGAPGTDNSATDTFGRRGSVHWATSATTRIETEAGLLSVAIDKWLDNGGVPGDALDPGFLSGAQDKFYESLSSLPASGTDAVGGLSRMGYSAARDDAWSALSASVNPLVPADSASEPALTLLLPDALQTATVATPLADDALLFLMKTQASTPEDADMPQTEESANDVDDVVVPAAAAPTLSRQLHALGERHARANADLLSRLEKLTV